MVNRQQPILTLSVAAQLLSLHPRTLMFYEREGLIKPHRTSTNRRLFSQADLLHLQFVKYLAEKQRINTAGIRVVLALLEKTKAQNSKIREELFPDFEEKQLI